MRLGLATFTPVNTAMLNIFASKARGALVYEACDLVSLPSKLEFPSEYVTSL